MKKSLLVVLSAMVIFSGLSNVALCQGLPGEKFFDITQITAPKGLPMALAKGISDDGKMTMLSFLFPDKAQLLAGTEKEMVAIADYGVESFFNPLIMTNSGAIVGDQNEGWDSFPSVMFVSDGQEKTIKLTEYGRVIAAKSDAVGKVYILVSRNDELVLCVATASGVELEIIVAERSYYAYYGEGGVSINEETGVICLIAPTSLSFGDAYFSFLSIFEMDLTSLVVNNNYIFGWDEEAQYLATVNFGGVDGMNMVGQYDGQAFIYDLNTGDLQVYFVGQDSDSYDVQAKGIYSESWLTGELGSASLFFQHMEADAKIVVDFPFDYMTIVTVKGGKIVVQTGDSQFYLLTLKSTARH